MRLRVLAGGELLLTLVAAAAAGGVGVWTTNGPPEGGFGLITDTQTPGVLYTAGESGLYRSTDNGTTWVATTPLGGGHYSPLATGSGRTVYASGPYTANNGAYDAVFSSPDGGMSWRVMTYGDVRTSFALTVDPVTPTTLYLVHIYQRGPVDASGLSRSADGGFTWTSIGAGLGRITHLVVAPSVPSTLYAFADALPSAPRGLSRSEDSGTTWVLVNPSLRDVTDLDVDPGNPSIVYAVTSTSGVLKSVDGGSSFAPMNDGLTSDHVHSIAIDPLRASRVYVATVTDVYASEDGGSHWKSLSFPDSGAIGITGLAIDSTGRYLHAATPSEVFDYQFTMLNCPADAHRLCLNNGRFEVTADFRRTPEGPLVSAMAVNLTADTGYFWFFDSSNVEVVAKVLDGCSANGHYWFFAGGLTNVGVEINVRDTALGTEKSYSNHLGTSFAPIQDTAAFATCP